MNVEIFFYYVMLIFGIVFVIVPIIVIYKIRTKEEFRRFVKMLVMLAMGILALCITLPSAKNMIFRDFEVVEGKCIVEMHLSGKKSEIRGNYYNARI